MREFCMLSALLFVSVVGLQAQATDSKIGPQVKLTVVHGTSRPDESPVRIRVELWNTGKEDLVVGKELFPIMNAPAYLQLHFTDETNEEHNGATLSIDSTRFIQDSSWTIIAPMHFYGVEIELDLDSFPFIRKAGKYFVTAVYHSDGYARPTPESGGPTVSVWKGDANSNTAQFTIPRRPR